MVWDHKRSSNHIASMSSSSRSSLHLHLYGLCTYTMIPSPLFPLRSFLYSVKVEMVTSPSVMVLFNQVSDIPSMVGRLASSRAVLTSSILLSTLWVFRWHRVSELLQSRSGEGLSTGWVASSAISSRSEVWRICEVSTMESAVSLSGRLIGVGYVVKWQSFT